MASEYYRVTDWQTRLRSLVFAVGLVIWALVLGTLVPGLVLSALSAFGMQVTAVNELPTAAYLLVTSSQFVGFGLAVYSFLYWRDGDDLFSLRMPTLRDVAWIVGGTVALFGLNLLFGLIIQYFGLKSAPNVVISGNKDTPIRFLYLIPVTVLVVAPAEELLFRGAVQGLFRRAYGVVPGILLASAIFGAIHFVALTGSGKLTYVAVAAALGIVLGTLYEVTDNLAVPIVAHGLWNTYTFLVQYLLATGAITAG